MSNKVIKNRTYYFFNDTTNIENFDLNNIKIDEKVTDSCRDGGNVRICSASQVRFLGD